MYVANVCGRCGQPETRPAGAWASAMDLGNVAVDIVVLVVAALTT